MHSCVHGVRVHGPNPKSVEHGSVTKTIVHGLGNRTQKITKWDRNQSEKEQRNHQCWDTLVFSRLYPAERSYVNFRAIAIRHLCTEPTKAGTIQRHYFYFIMIMFIFKKADAERVQSANKMLTYSTGSQQKSQISRAWRLCLSARICTHELPCFFQSDILLDTWVGVLWSEYLWQPVLSIR